MLGHLRYQTQINKTEPNNECCIPPERWGMRDNTFVIPTIWCIIVGTTGGLGVRSPLTNIHNYTTSWVYNRPNLRTRRRTSVSVVHKGVKQESWGWTYVPSDRVHIALNIIGKLAYTLVRTLCEFVRLPGTNISARFVWSAELRVHYLIIILINQNNKSYI